MARSGRLVAIGTAVWSVRTGRQPTLAAWVAALAAAWRPLPIGGSVTDARMVIALRRLDQSDAELLHSMLQRNADHLTQRGDYADEVALTLEEVRARLADAIVRFAIEEGDEPVGHLALVPVDPPHWTVGYWVAADHVGRGVCTAAVRLALDEARALGAVDLYAGVTHGNEPSIAVLRKLGFEIAADLDTYTRFRIDLSG